MLVAGSMVGSGSGIFIVAADMARQVGPRAGSSRYAAAEAAATAAAAVEDVHRAARDAQSVRRGASRGGGEDGMARGRSRSSCPRDCVRWWGAELHLARLVVKAASFLTACAMCFAEIPAASSISADLPDPGMWRTARCMNRTISRRRWPPREPREPRRRARLRPSGPRRHREALGRPQRVHERDGIDGLHGIGVDHADLDRVPQLVGGRHRLADGDVRRDHRDPVV